MTNLLVIREQMKKIYGKYEAYLKPLGKFLLALITFSIINSRIGYYTSLNNAAIVLILALLCSILPWNLTVVIAAVLTLLHLYAMSMECALIALCLYLILFILYFRFSPQDTLAVLFVPICYVMKIPYIIPLALGLIGTPASAVAVVCGVIVFDVLAYMNDSVAVLNSYEASAVLDKIRYILDGILGNKEILVTCIAFAAAVVVVYFIRRLSIDYAWTIAIITGTLLMVLVELFGDLMFDTSISVVGLILGCIVSALIAKLLEFFVFNVDYSRTENVQFEDDEYYYYVKAVPKNTVATPEKRVKTIRVPEKAVNHPKK